jgi:CheY-like chemotaxis protein
MNRPIFLVEDNPMDAELMLRAFEQRMLVNPVVVARDGEAVMDWIPRWEAGEPKPVVILLDLNMPRMSGFEVLQALKAHPVMRGIPVVVLSTSTINRDVQAAYEHGANSYLVKPVDFDKFLFIVGQITEYWAGTNLPPQ